MTGLQLLTHSIITVIPNSTGYKDCSYILQELPLFVCLDQLPTLCKSRLIEIRNMTYHSDEQSQAKNEVPRFYISGKFERKFKDGKEIFNIRDNTISERTNLMCVDIDKKDNPDIDLNEIRSKIFELPYVLGVYYSVSGEGIYAIMRIESTDYIKEHYEYIVKLWNQKFGIKIDKQACNIARARIISYNEDWKQWTKINEDVSVFKLRIIKEEPKPEIPLIKQTSYMDEDKKMEFTHKAIVKVLNSGYCLDSSLDSSYAAWYYLACEFKNFDDGLDLFIKLSNNGNWHDDYDTIRKKYDEATPCPIEDVHRKWQGMAKHRFGIKWWKDK